MLFRSQGRKIKAIARELRLARNTVRDIVRAGETSTATERRYVRVEPSLPQLGNHVAALDKMLADTATKPKRERLTYQRMFEELRGAGYTGGYDAVRRYGRAWAVREGAARAAAFVPLIFAAGEAYQFDWSHEHVLLDGAAVTVKLAQVRLCHSRMLFVRAYMREVWRVNLGETAAAIRMGCGGRVRGDDHRDSFRTQAVCDCR